MSEKTLDRLLHRFERDLRLVRLLRWSWLALLVVVMFAMPFIRSEWAMHGIMGVLVLIAMLWLVLTAWSGRRAQAVQLGSALAATGEFDAATPLLVEAMRTFSIMPAVKLSACHQLAVVAHRRGDHLAAVRLCRGLLRQPLRLTRWMRTQARLVLADSLLTLDEIVAAYEAFRPVYEGPLSLVDRLALLPIQLRYELQTGHAGAAVRALGEKVRLAELLDGRKAALVHALLAEACRRENRSTDCRYLTERADLYHDLDDVARTQPVVEPLLELHGRKHRD